MYYKSHNFLAQYVSLTKTFTIASVPGSVVWRHFLAAARQLIQLKNTHFVSYSIRDVLGLCPAAPFKYSLV